MKRSHYPLIALAAALAFPPAFAQTLYKLIDKNGKVTYSESKPKQFDGQVIQMNIDPNANTATLPKPPAPPEPAAPEARSNRAPAELTGAQRVEAAKAKLERARKELKSAQDNPGQGDINWIGNVGGGTRAIPSEDYQKRLALLERNVKSAEEELRVAEGR